MNIDWGNLFTSGNQVTENVTTTTGVSSQNVDVGNLLQQLGIGQTISGEIQEITNGQLLLSLANGSLIQAQVDTSANIQLGQTMFFQVSSTTESKIELRPIFTNLATEETAIKAVEMANISLKEEVLNLVKSMIDAQMPIDKQNVLDMYKQMLNFPNANPSTLVALKQLDIPITLENITQYEQYQQQEHQLLYQVDSLTDKVPDLLRDMFGQVIVGAGQSGEEPFTGELTKFLEVFTKEQVESNTLQGTSLLGLEEMSQSKGSNEIDTLIQYGKDAGASTQDILKQLIQMISQGQLGEEVIKQVRSSKEFVPFLNEVMKSEWLLKPETLSNKTVEDLYKQLSEQTTKLLDHLTEFGRQDSSFGKATSSIQQNVDFMNQVNQFANYIQLPMKMSGQNAHGELYVYANKKSLKDKEDDLTAFLHLDMDHLGPVNVYVTLQQEKVNTKFTLADDDSYDLIEENIELLNDKIKKLGFQVESEIVLEEKMQKITDVLFQKVKVEPNLLKSRLSFDIRA